MTRLQDLSPAELRLLRAGKAVAAHDAARTVAPGAFARPTSTTIVVDAPGATAWWRCHDCPATFTTWAAAERHADKERHPRIEWTGGDHG